MVILKNKTEEILNRWKLDRHYVELSIQETAEICTKINKQMKQYKTLYKGNNVDIYI